MARNEPQFDSFDPHKWRLYRVIALIALLSLLGASWRLWIPVSDFPAVPLLPKIASWITPAASDDSSFADIGALPNGPNFSVPLFVYRCVVCCALVVMCVGAVAAGLGGFSQRLHRWSWCYAAGFLILVSCNTHCLQPWAYHWLALSGLFLLASPDDLASQRRAKYWARNLTIGVYFWSALSKFDAQYNFTVGAEMLQQILKWLSNLTHNQGVDTATTSQILIDSQSLSVSPRWQQLGYWPLLFPCGELGIAALLCIRRTAHWGAWGALFMHLLLFFVLGPWGLGHKPGVLLWNAFFAIQGPLLFGGRPARLSSMEITFPAPPTSSPTDSSTRSPKRKPVIANLAIFVVMAMLFLPSIERWGWWDHWPAWGLYAPHSSRASLLIPADQLQRLPESLQRQFPRSPPEDSTTWLRVPMERWSLETLGVPIYPQARFQLGVAQAVAQRLDDPEDARLELFSVARRQDGERQKQTCYGLNAMSAAESQFWLGSRPVVITMPHALAQEDQHNPQ
jgi:hypothetical protein